jgi:hypothetical protein
MRRRRKPRTSFGKRGKLIARAPCPRCRERGEDSSGDNLGLFDDGHAYCFSCRYYEISVDIKDKLLDIVDVGGEDTPTLETSDDSGSSGGSGAYDSIALDPRSSRNTGTYETNGFIDYYRDKYKN